MSQQTKQNQHGFTIVELMIALTILSVILVIAATLMIGIGRLFNKGINAASLSNTNRNIVSDITSTIEFGSEAPVIDPANSVFCVGKERYTYIVKKKQGKDYDNTVTKHVLWHDTLVSSQSCTRADINADKPSGIGAGITGTDGFDMVPVNMRLTKFSVTPTPKGSGVYKVEVNMAYGDSDLLSDPDPVSDPDGERPNCKGDAGTEFCGLSHIAQTTVRRLK